MICAEHNLISYGISQFYIFVLQ